MDANIVLANASVKLRQERIRNLKTGDLVKVHAEFMPFIYHYGIICRDQQDFIVYHNDPDRKNKSGGNIIRESFEKWIAGREIVEVSPTNLNITDIEAVVKKLKSQRYHLLQFNCEHFITKLRDKKPTSMQVAGFSVVALAILTTTILLIKRKK